MTDLRLILHSQEARTDSTIGSKRHEFSERAIRVGRLSNLNGYSRDGRTPRETSGTASESVELPVLFGRANEKEEVWDFLL
jgi:hypothetical protein